MASWPVPSLVQHIQDTWLGDVDETYFSKTVDAYLYLGPRDLLLTDPHPAEVFLDKEYMAEMKRRAAIMGEGPLTDQADPEKVSDRDYSPFFYDPDEMQKMMRFQKMGFGPAPPK